MTHKKNGQQKAQENISSVVIWIAERDMRRDWCSYSYNYRINRRVVAEMLNFAKSVCTQNPAVRKLLEDADKRWFKSEAIKQVAKEAAADRERVQSDKRTSDNSILLKRIVELEAENQKMRQEIKAFKAQQASVLDGLPGFKL